MFCSRSQTQNCLFHAGCFVQKHSVLVIASVFTIFTICCFGLQYVRIETDIVKLWVSQGGRLDEELNYFSKVQQQYGHDQKRKWEYEKHFVFEEQDPKLNQIPEDEAASSGYQVLIQTAEGGSHNVLTKDGLVRHVDLLLEIVHLEVEKFGMNWTLSDICFKPGALDIDNDSIAYVMKPTLERLIPCIWITPIDCFFEGSKPIGPSPPIDTSKIPLGELLRVAMPNLPKKATWSNINPEDIVKELYANFDLGTVMNFFLRTGIDNGYMDRPCLDPLDPDCPSTSPNYYHGACTNLQIFKRHMAAEGRNSSALLAKYMDEDKLVEQDSGTSVFDIFGAFLSGSNSDTKSDNRTVKEKEHDKDCKTYRGAFLGWLNSNKEIATKILPHNWMPTYPNYGKVMQHGCRGFAKSVMNWPTDMILGGITDDGNSIEAEALQSVILVASPTDVYKRFKVCSFTLPHYLTILAAGDIPKPSERIIHPLAGTSISDMLAEFCDFNYSIICAGYFLMLIYAVYSQIRWDGCCLLSVNSATGLAFAGVLTVTFASVAGLGTSTWFRIEFNAATTQIVPFLTLGIGVDNMFLLLHNYPQVASRIKENEIGVLLKETGMSILMTSINNILSFLTGTVLPIQLCAHFALRRDHLTISSR
uniref:SSD domain-containing protein n=1 Tax=Ditylenchus dipsaci TaxID=166011 RepID=A0A915DJ56_9BILA